VRLPTSLSRQPASGLAELSVTFLNGGQFVQLSFDRAYALIATRQP